MRVDVKTELDWTKTVRMAPTNIARYPVSHPKPYTGMSLFTPVRIASLTFSPSRELSSLTMPMRQLQSMTRLTMRRITPAPVSPMLAP